MDAIKPGTVTLPVLRSHEATYKNVTYTGYEVKGVTRAVTSASGAFPDGILCARVYTKKAGWGTRVVKVLASAEDVDAAWVAAMNGENVTVPCAVPLPEWVLQEPGQGTANSE
jgi:hypothetical protein